MHKNATKCNKTQSKWCVNKHGASKIIDMFETYQGPAEIQQESVGYYSVIGGPKELFSVSPHPRSHLIP
jgi:hypothetical protein